ncbi:hypothetical protein M885DRAFT_562881, partial [Pelagophyceae sp. CCMP2097]
MVLLKALQLGLVFCSFLIEAQSPDDYNGKVFYGADSRFCYKVVFGGSILQDVETKTSCASRTYTEGLDNIYSTGNYVNTLDNVQNFEDGRFCGDTDKDRSSTLSIEIDELADSIALTSDEPDT